MKTKDYIEILKQSGELLYSLHGKTLFITGATGFIGAHFVKAVLFYNKQANANIKVMALVRNKNRANHIFQHYFSNNLIFIEGDVENIPKIDYPIDFIVHGASVTSSFDFVNKPVDTIKTTIWGTQNILELARFKKVESFLYLSTMEVYGFPQKNGEQVFENDYGYINLLKARSSYPVSKRMAENICAAYATQYDLPIVIARLAQTLGSGISYNDTRLSAYFARSVIEQKDIILNTKGTTKRSIVYISDAISALLFILLKGQKGEAYSVANSKEILSVSETADLIIRKIADNKIALKFELKNMPEYAANVDLHLELNTDKLESLGWQPKIGIEESYRRMINDMRNEVDA